MEKLDNRFVRPNLITVLYKHSQTNLDLLLLAIKKFKKGLQKISKPFGIFNKTIPLFFNLTSKSRLSPFKPANAWTPSYQFRSPKALSGNQVFANLKSTSQIVTIGCQGLDPDQ
jgi:hypothetical protein